MSDLTWTNEKRKLSELTPWPRNPRQIKQDQAKRLNESLDEFGQVDVIAIGPGGEVYNGHQRLNVWADEHGPDFEVDVRVASRALTEKEREKLVVFLHKGAAGEWDFDTLANEFELGELLEWGFEGWELGMVEADDFSDLDDELAALAGLEEIDIKITVPAMHEESVIDWLSNGEAKTAPGMGKGVLRRCGLL